MDKDDIIRMAREAGAEQNPDFSDWSFDDDQIERFATLVAAAEREECAKVAESYEPHCDTCPSGAANAIRARGHE